MARSRIDTAVRGSVAQEATGSAWIALWKSQIRTTPGPGTTPASAIARRTWCVVVSVPLAAQQLDTRERRTGHGQTAMGSEDGAAAHDVRRNARGLAGGGPDARLRARLALRPFRADPG